MSIVKQKKKVPRRQGAHICAGPAHAVYFATYEAVKHVMGGNQAGVHHPLAAGMFETIPIWVLH